MKLPGMLMMAKAFIRGARALEGIEAQLTRLANAHEGISPPAREVPDLPAEPVRLIPSADFLAVDQARIKLTQLMGHEPSPEELAHELDGEEWGAESLPTKTRERLGL